jgi:hypothetical protein
MNDNQEHLAFNHQIGMALSQWQHVEWDLYNIRQACTGDHPTGDAYVTHFELRSFRDKLGQVNGLVLANFPNTPHLADWKSLHRRTDNAARNGRNPLAHHWILEYPNDKPGRRWWLIPHPAIVPPGWRQKLPPGSLCVRDISAIFHRFSALKCALDNFAHRLRGQADRFPKDMEQEKPPLTLAELVHEIRALAGCP